MAVNLTINGVIYSFPTEGDQDWGPSVTAFAQAISASAFYKSGGVFTLTADADFGASFGLKAIFKSRSANIADAGVLRLANLDAIAWRNAANSANLNLTVDASNQLLFNGTPLLFGIVPLSSLQTVTGSRALVSTAGGVISASTVTDVELGHLSGVTSPVQTQLNAKMNNSVLTANGSIPMRYGGITQEIPIGNPGDHLVVVADSANWVPNTPPRMLVADLPDGYGISDEEHGTLFKAQTSVGFITAALPEIHTAGTYYEIKDVSNNAATNNITIIPSPLTTDTIDLGGGYSISTDNGSVKIISDGNNWWTIGGV